MLQLLTISKNAAKIHGLLFLVFFLSLLVTNANSNDMSTASPINLNTTVEGQIIPAGDQDWFYVDVAGEGQLSAAVTNVPTDLRVCVQLLSASGGSLGSYCGGGNGQDAYVTYTVSSAGRYYVKVYGYYSSSASTSPYTLAATFTPVNDIYEDNNSINEAVLLRWNEPVMGRIYPAGDQDWFYVDVVGEGQLSAAVTGVPSDLQVCVQLLNSSGGSAGSNCGSSGGEDAYVTYTVSGAERYYVKVYGYYSASASASPYTLAANFTSVGDVYEPNDDINEAKPLGLKAPVSGRIYPAGDQDWFYLDGIQVGQLSVAVTGVPSDLQVCVQLLNSSGGSAGSNCGSSVGQDAHVTYTVSSAGRYYVKVYGYYSTSVSMSPYTLVAVWTASGGSDSHEPNGDFGSATGLSLGVPEAAYINPGSDHDWYRVSVGGRGLLRFSVTNIASSMTVKLRAYKSTQELIKEVGPASGSVDVELGVEGAGTYYFEVYDTKAVGSSQAYVVLADFVGEDGNEPNDGFDSATLVMVNTPKSGTILPEGDTDWYRVEIVEPGVFSWWLTKVPWSLGSLTMKLYDSQQNLLKTTTERTLTYTVVEGKTGFYYLELYHASNEYSWEPYEVMVDSKIVSDAPQVISTFPNNGAVGVALDTAILATFNRDMNGVTLNYDTFELSDSSSQRVFGTVTYDGVSWSSLLLGFNPRTRAGCDLLQKPPA